MTDVTGVDAWSMEAWRSTAIEWIDRRLDATGIERTGDVAQPRIRPWGTVMTVPTDEGTIWFMAAAPEAAFEVALYPLLRQRVPDAVLAVLAVDVERGWMLLPDGGVHLGDVVGGQDLVDAMVTVLPRYAEL